METFAFKDLEEVKLYKVFDIKNNRINEDNNKDIFTNSGLRWVSKIFEKHGINEYFFEFVSLASTVEIGKLCDFILLSTKVEEFKSKLDNNYLSLINYYHENGLAISYHPKFFLNTDSLKYYYSVLTAKNDKIGSGYNKPQDSVDIGFCNIDEIHHIQNMTLPYTYDDFVLKSKEKTIISHEPLKLVEIMHNDLCKILGHNESVLFCVPLLGSGVNDESAYSGTGFFMFYINNFNLNGKTKIGNETIKNDIVITNIINSINTFYKNVSISFLFNSGIELAKKTRENAIKSAIAAVMSRNMSHNLGSHVFFYTRQELLKIYDNQKNDESVNDNSRMIKGMAWFMHYVQERQDFIANINSGDDFLFGPLNFKQDVIDEITPDGVDNRHNSLPQTKNYLLENIVRSENIIRQDCIPANEANYDGFDKTNADSEIKDIDISVLFGNKKWLSTWHNKDITAFYDIDIAVGGGQQSRHAFLIVLENIIRNSAKHGGKLLKGKYNKLKITIEIIEKMITNVTKSGKVNISGYEITIYDNVENANIHRDEKSGIFNIDFLISKLQNIKMLEKSSVEINRESKGLKEILIAVLWMKGLALQDIESYSKDKDILSIEEINKSIGFRFYLPKFQNCIELKQEDIENLLLHNEINAFGSIYTVDDSVLKNVISNPAFARFKSLDALKSDLSLRIPRIIFGVPKAENIWQYLYEERVGKNSAHIISFDRVEKKDIIKNLRNKVFLLYQKDASGAKIVFKNHLSQSIIAMENLRNMFNSNYFGKPDAKIFETISGANQVFNLMQKFNANVSDDNDRLIEKLTSLYWNILEAYTIKVVIVDERLSYADYKEQCIDNNILSLVETKLKAGKFSDIYFPDEKKERLTIIKKITSILNNRTTDNTSKAKDVVEFMDHGVNEIIGLKESKLFFRLSSNNGFNATFDNQNGNVKIVASDIKELFYNQQHTFLFNLNDKHEMVQSSGKFIFPNPTKVDFFSIHIGLLDKMPGNDLIRKIKEIFEINNLDSRFVSVHSGRGGLNSDEENVTFIPFSVLQRCLEDSKYMLSEFLNNYKYLPI